VTALVVAALLAAGPPGPPGPDLDAARTAWRYFENNTDPVTGLVRSVDGYPSTTAWDLGSAVLATAAASALGIVDDEELETRMRPLLETLATMPLFDGALPNKAYDTRTAAMTDYANRAAPKGIGFSAVDLGRLVTALAFLGDGHPALREPILRALARWATGCAVRGGELRGVHGDGAGRLRDLQEGRLGYEQYAAKGFGLLGLDVSLARRYDRFAAKASVLGVPVPRDARDFRRFGALDAVTTEPWALDALELGLDPAAAPLADRVFDVQKRRFEETGVVTALSEDHVDRPPWFAYGAVWADGAPWRALAPDGADAAALRGLSTKAAFALAVLHPEDPYAGVLRDAIASARDPERGWFAGVYERGETNRSLSANTNAVVLEAVLFEARGPLLAAGDSEAVRAWRARLGELGPRARVCPASRSIDPGAGAGAGDPAVQGAADALIVPRPRGARGGPRLGGALLFDYRGAEGPGAGGIVTAYPWRAMFLRLGAESTPLAPFITPGGNRVRLLWGLGYDDWHDRTFSFSVHNWGPLTPENAPAVRRAEANAGYKLPRLCSEWLCAGTYVSATVPFSGGPYADARVTLTLFGRLFVMGGIGRTLPGVFPGPPGTPALRYVWGFGWADWRPGGIFVTYHDWGPNSEVRNGILSVGMNWRF